MRICHVVYECIPGSFAGGVQKMVYELAQTQGRRGDTVEIWTIGKRRDLELSAGLRIRYFPGRLRWGSLRLRKALMLERTRFDVIHAHNTFLPLNRYVAAAARKGARVFFHAHGALDPRLLEGWKTKALKKRVYISVLERSNYDAAQAVFGLTGEECRQLMAFGTRAAIYQAGNGIDSKAPAASVAVVGFRLRHRIGPQQPVILFIGRITHKKGLHYLVQALGLILRQLPETLLVICGGREQDRDYVAALDAQIARLHLESQVRWTGFVDEEGKRAAFAAGTVFVHSSYSEGMALAVLEAMSFGLPTVVTPGCYMDEAVAAGAIELAQQSAESLGAVIAGLLLDKTRAGLLAASGRDYVVQHHAWPPVAERLARIYAGMPGPAPYRARLAG